NFSQASSHALPGVHGDPLVGSYYGTLYDANGYISGIDPTKADCGYGLGQITTHMTKADSTWPADVKREVATDYQVNVAAAVSFLVQDWNILKADNIIANDADPSSI